MKKIIVCCLVAVMAFGAASAQKKNDKKESKIVTTTFVTDIDCEHCAKRIMENIPMERGVKDVEVDVPTKTVTVKYDASKNTKEGLVKAFESIRVKCFDAKENGAAAKCDGKCDDKCDGHGRKRGHDHGHGKK